MSASLPAVDSSWARAAAPSTIGLAAAAVGPHCASQPKKPRAVYSEQAPDSGSPRA